VQNATIKLLFNDRREYGDHNEKGIDNPLSILSNSKMSNKKLSNAKTNIFYYAT
jgi:hypothetical protein